MFLPDMGQDYFPAVGWSPRRLQIVELIGIEPTTSGLQSPRSPS